MILANVIVENCESETKEVKVPKDGRQRDAGYADIFVMHELGFRIIRRIHF